ncbi:hypothetical protein ACFO26_03460 [Lactococcus nasutitermitis]|uniref:ATPase n=1 Tax=Lactococcus nasutitermitis TaxID=1652957 RepID=A0ABV9JEZ5_9LACT|nr:hypothetical protein [Lactococcus nasutitermitis]
MKKYINGFIVLILLGINSGTVLAETGTIQSSSATQVSSSSSQSNQSTEQSQSSQSSENTTSSSTPATVNNDSQNQTVTSTTAQDNAPVAPATTNQPQTNTENSNEHGKTSSSTTIIKETVNNNRANSNSNIWLIVLSSLSALVTITGGVIAVFRHFHKQIKKRKMPTDDGVEASNLTTKENTQNNKNVKGYQSQRHTMTQEQSTIQQFSRRRSHK